MLPTDWTERAACQGEDTELFFPTSSAEPAAAHAKAICASCEVVEECLSAALDRGERYGIWGGTTPEERYRWATARGSPWRGAAPCGTEGAYRRHRRAGEQPCGSCREANRRAEARRRAA